MNDPGPSTRCELSGEQPIIIASWKLSLVSVALFAIAVALRMPSCYESLWLDELHSAWVVWDDLGQVAHRAQMGHQSPFYFYGLWCWKQLVGESELALRMSSVLMLATSSVVLTVGVARWSGSLAAGAAAGMVLASEDNALFFGTELRPYAAVVLFSSLAVIAFLRLADSESRHEKQQTWICFVGAVLLATLCQPTAIGVLAWLVLALAAIWIMRGGRRTWNAGLTDLGLLVATIAVGLALWSFTLNESWQNRSDWASFAQSRQLSQLWDPAKSWDWTWLALIPLGVTLLAALLRRWQHGAFGNRWLAAVSLAIVALLATGFFWAISQQWVPLWHRRYFIAVLPILACVSGVGVAAIADLFHCHIRRSVFSTLAAIGILFGLGYHQGTLQQLPRYPVALAKRGEDWRGAVQWIRENTPADATIQLSCGLIEANKLPRPGVFGVRNWFSDEEFEYRSFPVRGPYQLDGRYVHIPPMLSFAFAQPEIRLQRQPLASVGTAPRGAQKIGFGGVSVIVIPLGR